MKPSRILVHIGYHKTGSTWLQQVLFSKKDLGFLAIPRDELIEEFALVNSFSFNPHLARKKFELSLAEAIKNNLVLVLSYEALSGNPIKQKYWSKEVAEIIHETFPDARILIVIREQKSMILSWYKQYIKVGGHKPLASFIGMAGKKVGFSPLCRLDHLQFDLFISFYQKLFGRSSVLILPFEILKQNSIIFGNKIIEFSGSNGILNHQPHLNARNIGSKAGSLSIRRQINKLTGLAEFGDDQPPLSWRWAQKISSISDVLIPDNIHQSKEAHMCLYIDETVGDFFRDSNRKTSRLTGINLAELGYDC